MANNDNQHSNHTARPAILALADGSVFYGVAIGAMGRAVGEVVFNTAMTGYQEILTDPSYAEQLVTLTYPHIGNTGCNSEDNESGRMQKVWAAGLIIRDLPLVYSNFRGQESLEAYLHRQNVVAIADIDTRRLTRLLRDKGAQNGCIMTGDAAGIDEAMALQLAQNYPGLQGKDLAKVCCDPDGFTWTEGSWALGEGFAQPDLRYHVVAYDFGTKTNILRMLADRGCRLSVVPATTPAADVLALNPDGIFLSNGPGDPAACTYAIDALKTLLETSNIPIFGICLGHQLLALASGGRTLKMKFGHHGANHPVQDLATGRVMISSQNHGFCVDDSDLPDCLQVTHRSLFDGSNQGIARLDRPAFSFQGHPEASPGPHDCSGLFDQFVQMMEGRS